MRILHVGPYDAKGGISSVMKTLISYNSEIISNDVINTYSDSGVVSKIFAYSKAKRQLKSKLVSDNTDIVHIHSASDFSFMRKIKLAKIALNHRLNVVFHIHSGDLSRWLREKDRYKKYSKIFSESRMNIVCLSEYWSKEFENILAKSDVIANPVNSIHKPTAKKEDGKLCLLGRDDVVKGHDFAINLVNRLNAKGISVKLHCTGIKRSNSDFVISHGWLSEEEKVDLISSSQITLIPSKFEGLPVIALESLACGTNVLANKSIFGLPDAVFSAEDFDFDDWEKKIVEILERTDSDELIDKAAEYSQDKICQKWINYYSKIIDS